MVKYADTDRKPGTYRARFVKLDTEYRMTDRESGEEVIRWRWVFQETADSTTVGELDTITSTSFRARTNGLKFFTGMLGRTPTEDDDTDALIGQEFDVLWGPNQNGRLTIVAVTRPVGSPPAAKGAAVNAGGTVEATPSSEPTIPDELPF